MSREPLPTITMTKPPSKRVEYQQGAELNGTIDDRRHRQSDPRLRKSPGPSQFSCRTYLTRDRARQTALARASLAGRVRTRQSAGEAGRKIGVDAGRSVSPVDRNSEQQMPFTFTEVEPDAD
jgi:hypothetical protein